MKGVQDMKKMMSAVAVAAVMVGVGMAIAGGWLSPIATNLTAAGATTKSYVYTNSTSMTEDIQSILINGTLMTNGSIRIANSTAYTNTLPATYAGSTLYYIPAGAIPLLPSGRILITAILSSTNSSKVAVQIYRTAR